MDQISDSAGLSMRAYAKRRGVSHVAVQRAVNRGRLVKSVVRDAAGNVRIVDPDLADREWAANTDLTKAPAYVKDRAASLDADPDDTDAPEAGDLPGGLTTSEATARLKGWQAKLAEVKFRREAGELVPAAQVAAKLANVFATCKAKLLGIPSRAKQADPNLTTAQVTLIEGLIREALEDLATGDGA